MSVFSPYIHFRGQCAEAMRRYAEVFGATDLFMMTYGEAPPDFPVPDSHRQRIMHASISIDGGWLMASDYPPGSEGEPQAGVSVACEARDAERGRSLHAALLQGGGAEIMPFGPTFFSPGFGMLKDRFGTHWMVIVPQPRPADPAT